MTTPQGHLLIRAQRREAGRPDLNAPARALQSGAGALANRVHDDSTARHCLLLALRGVRRPAVMPAWQQAPAAHTAPHSARRPSSAQEREIKLQFRYRYGTSTRQTRSRADASTLKSRLTYTRWLQGLAGAGRGRRRERDRDEDFNATSNNETAYSVVRTRGHRVNQASVLVGFATRLKGGRQRILLDTNASWALGWRQNEQTFDGGSIVNKSDQDTTLSYSYSTT